jgi:hypothetical protein
MLAETLIATSGSANELLTIDNYTSDLSDFMDNSMYFEQIFPRFREFLDFPANLVHDGFIF